MKRALALCGFMVALAGCGGTTAAPQDDSANVSSMVGGSCLRTDFTLHGAQMYSCFIKGHERCVTVHDGVATDDTEAARMYFENVISGEKPLCAS